MTIGSARAMQEVDAAVRAAGGDVLDAPVSGGTPATAQGTWTIMAGEDASVLEALMTFEPTRCLPPTDHHSRDKYSGHDQQEGTAPAVRERRQGHCGQSLWRVKG